MSDIWDKAGREQRGKPDSWLYEVDGQVHGPVSRDVIVEKLQQGLLRTDIRVARENTEFFPITQVAAFGSHLESLGDREQKKERNKFRLVLSTLLLVTLTSIYMGASHFMSKQEEQQKKVEAEQARLDAEREKEEKERKRIINQRLKVVSLVRFDADALEIGKNKPTRRPKKTRRGGRKGRKIGNTKSPGLTGSSGSRESFVSSCTRGQKDIIGVLAKNIRKINFKCNLSCPKLGAPLLHSKEEVGCEALSSISDYMDSPSDVEIVRTID